MNYLDAISLGLKKATDSEIARQEVDNVFEVINSELRSFPDGAIYLKRAQITLASSKLINAIAAATFGMPAIANASISPAPSSVREKFMPERQLELCLAAKGQELRSTVADWEQSADGYPCTLKFEGSSISCFSSVELESAIKELLSSVTLGEALKSLLKRASAL